MYGEQQSGAVLSVSEWVHREALAKLNIYQLFLKGKHKPTVTEEPDSYLQIGRLMRIRAHLLALLFISISPPCNSIICLFKFCICWFIFPFLFFSASSGKLLTYILPCFPPLAILSGLGFTEYLKSNSTKTFQIGAGIAAVIFGITMIALPGIQLLGFVEAPPFHMAWKWIAITGSLGIMVLLLITSIRYEAGLKKYIVFALSPVCLFITAHLTMPQQTLERKALEPLLQQYVKKVSPQTVILSSEDVVRAVCWYFKRDNVFLVESAGELHYGLNQEDSRSHISPEEASELIRKHPGNAILVTDRDQYNRWRQFLPKPLTIDTMGTRGYLLLRY